MSVWHQPTEMLHKTVQLVISKHHAFFKKQGRLKCMLSMIHNKALTVSPGREKATWRIVKIAGLNMTLTQVRWNGSVVFVRPEFYHVFPGTYQADFFSFKICCEFVHFCSSKCTFQFASCASTLSNPSVSLSLPFSVPFSYTVRTQ